MNARLRLLIHVGYHKTATSWMQAHLFQPVHGFTQIMTHAEAWTHIAAPHSLTFDPMPTRDIIAERIAALPQGQIPVVSSEVLSGQPFEGGHEGPVIASRLAKVFPDARILITIRDQFRIIPSIYMQYLLRGGTLPPKRFLQGTSEPGYRGFEADHFRYDLFTRHYHELFGAGAVMVATQESLSKDMTSFAEKIAAFGDVRKFTGLSDEAKVIQLPSYPEHAVSVLRRLNHMRSGALNPNPPFTLGQPPRDAYRLAGWLMRQPAMMRAFGHRKNVTALVRERLGGHFADGNRTLQALRPDLDLAGYEGILRRSP